jgi:hypothetical protein
MSQHIRWLLFCPDLFRLDAAPAPKSHADTHTVHPLPNSATALASLALAPPLSIMFKLLPLLLPLIFRDLGPGLEAN